MSTKTKRRSLFPCVPEGLLLLLVLVLGHFQTTGSSVFPRPRRKIVDKHTYILDQPDCKIPEVPIFNEALLGEWGPPDHDLGRCDPQPLILSFNFNTSTSDQSLISGINPPFLPEQCCITRILRPQELISDTFTLSECMPFTATDLDLDTIHTEEFLAVQCNHQNIQNIQNLHNVSKTSKLIEFHYRIPLEKERIQKKLTHWRNLPPHKPLPFSVMFLVLDAISRTHAYRSLPNTMKILQHLNFTDYRGYHCVGEPTIENVVPMFLGTAASDKWDKVRPNYTGKYDQLPFIWRNFSDGSYITLNIEDSTLWHSFNFNGRTGFTISPADFNLRPYMLAQEELNFKKTNRGKKVKYLDKDWDYEPLTCLDGQPIWKFVLTYSKSFLEKFPPSLIPTFGINWLVWPHHDYLTALQLLDEPLTSLIQSLPDIPGVMENTFILFMGDHGFRWANYSESAEGLLERNLPMFFSRLPNRFQKLYPKKAENFWRNADRLTSHFDLFKTLVDIHKLSLSSESESESDKAGAGSYGYNKPYGQSLFEEISPRRNCKDANIPKQYCACDYPLYKEEYKYDLWRKEAVIEGLG